MQAIAYVARIFIVDIFTDPVILPRRDLKTGKVAWPIDISHLLVEKTSEEDQRSSTVSVLVPKVIKWLLSHKNLRKHLLC